MCARDIVNVFIYEVYFSSFLYKSMEVYFIFLVFIELIVSFFRFKLFLLIILVGFLNV